MKQRVIKRFWNISLLISTFFVVFCVAFFPVEWHRQLLNLGFAMVFFASAFSVEAHGRFNVYFAIIVTGLILISNIFKLPQIGVVSDLASLGFFLYMVARFIIQISKSKIVDVKVIAESITGYLLLGMGFAILIAFAVAFNSESISFPSSEIMTNPDVANFTEYLYYSLVTMSTLGYGDVLPTMPYTKSLMTLITISGQFYMAVVVALLIGKFAASRTGN